MSLLDDERALRHLLDVLPFPIAFGVVIVGFALAIGHEIHAASAQHLHHQAGAAAGQAGDDHELLIGRHVALHRGSLLALFIKAALALSGKSGHAGRAFLAHAFRAETLRLAMFAAQDLKIQHRTVRCIV